MPLEYAHELTQLAAEGVPVRIGQRGEGVEAALAVANAAAAICVSRPGAAPSIPLLGEVAEKAT